ncbi:MAG: 6-bladed beta-propeller [Mongoliitalea sp.]
MKNFFIVILFFCFGCTNYSLESESAFTISINPDESIEGKFSDIFEDIEYVFLSNADDFPIIRPGKIVISDSSINLVDWDLDKFVSYNLKGQPLFQLTPSGDGPGEFIRAEDFQIKMASFGILIQGSCYSGFRIVIK